MCNEICNEIHVKLITFHFNKNCDFTIFGPIGDSGLTGRKIIADHMGGVYRHGGGSPNGKDASKVDISGQLFARYVAKHIIKEGLATDCEIQLG
jgi:S-adenosylmethionine synthetase